MIMNNTTLKLLELTIELATPIIPILILILGGQKLIDRYSIEKKKRESELDLACSIRKKQYEALQNLYSIFAEFMSIYRLTERLTRKELESQEIKDKFINMSIKSESKIDALILEIGCEFPPFETDEIDLKYLLGNLRQSVHLWREKFQEEEHLPFYFSGQENYMRFKTAFALVSAFMINRIYQGTEYTKISLFQVPEVLIDAFDNKHEDWKVNELNIKRFKKYMSREK